MAIDPNRSYYGHPILPNGYDSWEINGDEFNSAGVNEPVWPVLFDSFIAMEVLIVTEEMLNFFVTGCPDLIVASIDDTALIRGRQKLVLPKLPEKVSATAENSNIAFRPENNTIAAAKPDNDAQMTKRATRLPLRTKTSVLRIRR